MELKRYDHDLKEKVRIVISESASCLTNLHLLCVLAWMSLHVNPGSVLSPAQMLMLCKGPSETVRSH